MLKLTTWSRMHVETEEGMPRVLCLKREENAQSTILKE